MRLHAIHVARRVVLDSESSVHEADERTDGRPIADKEQIAVPHLELRHLIDMKRDITDGATAEVQGCLPAGLALQTLFDAESDERENDAARGCLYPTGIKMSDATDKDVGCAIDQVFKGRWDDARSGEGHGCNREKRNDEANAKSAKSHGSSLLNQDNLMPGRRVGMLAGV